MVKKSWQETVIKTDVELVSVFCFVMLCLDDILANLISLSLAFLAYGGNLVKTSTGFKRYQSKMKKDGKS